MRSVNAHVAKPPIESNARDRRLRNVSDSHLWHMTAALTGCGGLTSVSGIGASHPELDGLRATRHPVKISAVSEITAVT